MKRLKNKGLSLTNKILIGGFWLVSKLDKDKHKPYNVSDRTDMFIGSCLTKNKAMLWTQ